MKTLSAITLLLASAGISFAATINVDDPAGFNGTVTSQTFEQELGNYSASDFNTDAGRILTDFDAAAFNAGDTLNAVLYNTGVSGFSFRTDFNRVGNNGFRSLISTDSNFVSSSPNGLIWGGANSEGASLTFPESATTEIYGVGFTVVRLTTDAQVSLYSDTAGTNQIGTTVTLSANNGGSNYSFFGFAGDTVIRRVDVAATSQFALDDLVVTTSQIPEPSEQAMLLGGVAAGLILLRRRFRKSRA